MAKQVAYQQREDVTQSTPAILTLRLLLSLAASCCPLFSALPVLFGVWDISVANFHSMMDELVFVHPPSDLVPACWCWKLVKSIYGTRRASRLWASHVTRVLREQGCVALRVLPMVFYNPEQKYITGIWGDDFACVGSVKTL